MKQLTVRLPPLLAVAVSIAIAFVFDFAHVEHTRVLLDEIDRRPSKSVEPYPVFSIAPEIAFGEIRDPFERHFEDSEGSTSYYRDPDLQADTNPLKLEPGDFSLLGRQGEQALIRLPDGAVYLVAENDSLWGGKLIVESIVGNNVTIKVTDSDASDTYEKIYLRK